MSVKTIEQARALEEIESEFFEYAEEIKPDGTKVRTQKARPFCPAGIDGDDIIAFTDERGAWKVVQTKDGPRKVKFRL